MTEHEAPSGRANHATEAARKDLFADRLRTATAQHEDGFRRAKAVAGWFLGNEEWASLILAAYAGETGGLYGIARSQLREALDGRLDADEAERLMPDA